MSGHGGMRVWRRKESQVGNGSRSGERQALRLAVSFDDAMFAALRQLAADNGDPVGAVVRQLCAMGLEDIEDGTRGYVASAPARKVIDVPAWVPDALHDEYRDLAELEGEEAAAAFARRAKTRVA